MLTAPVDISRMTIFLLIAHLYTLGGKEALIDAACQKYYQVMSMGKSRKTDRGTKDHSLTCRQFIPVGSGKCTQFC